MFRWIAERRATARLRRDLPHLFVLDDNIAASSSRAVAIRREAVSKLERSTSWTATPALVARIRDQDNVTRDRAIKALGRLGDPRGHEALVALCEEATKRGEGIGEALARALRSLPWDTGNRWLTVALESKDAEAARVAGGTLAERGLSKSTRLNSREEWANKGDIAAFVELLECGVEVSPATSERIRQELLRKVWLKLWPHQMSDVDVKACTALRVGDALSALLALAVPPAHRQFHRHGYERRILAIRAICALGDRTVVTTLLEYLTTETVDEVRGALVGALSTLGRGDVITLLTTQLGETPRSGATAHERAALLHAVASLDPDATTATLAEHLFSHDERTDEVAALLSQRSDAPSKVLLSYFRHRRTLPVFATLVTLCAEQVVDTVKASGAWCCSVEAFLDAVVALEPSIAVNVLVALPHTTFDPQKVADGLGSISDSRATHVLLGWLAHGDMSTAVPAARALGRANHPEAVPALCRALEKATTTRYGEVLVRACAESLRQLLRSEEGQQTMATAVSKLMQVLADRPTIQYVEHHSSPQFADSPGTRLPDFYEKEDISDSSLAPCNAIVGLRTLLRDSESLEAVKAMRLLLDEPHFAWRACDALDEIMGDHLGDNARAWRERADQVLHERVPV